MLKIRSHGMKKKKNCAMPQNKSLVEFIRLNVVDVSQTATFLFNYIPNSYANRLAIVHIYFCATLSKENVAQKVRRNILWQTNTICV